MTGVGLPGPVTGTSAAIGVDMKCQDSSRMTACQSACIEVEQTPRRRGLASDRQLAAYAAHAYQTDDLKLGLF